MSQSGTYINSTPTPGTGVNTLTGNSGGPVSPTANNINLIGAHGIDIVGSPGISTLTVSIDNTIILGDLTTVTAGNDSITSFSGDISILAIGVNAAGNLNLPNTNAALSVGVIKVGGLPFIGEYGSLNNTGVGISSAAGLTTGINNTALGHNALFSETGGQNNVALGSSAGFFLDGSIDNTIVGASALGLGTIASSNTAIGSHALGALLIGESNIAIGQLAGQNYTSTESDNIVIGNNGVLGENNVIRIGTQGSGVGQQDTCFIAGITGVTVSNPAIVTINTVTGQLGVGTGAGSGIDSINGNIGTAVLPIAGAVNIRTLGTTIPFSGSSNTLTFDCINITNLIIGSTTTISGVSNTGLGLGSSTVLTTGSTNTAVGSLSLVSETTGSGNVAIGYKSCFFQSGADSNTALGTESLSLNTVGEFNTSLGRRSLFNTTNCSNNISIGNLSSSNYTSTESNNIIIGNAGILAENNTIRIGTQGAGSGQQNRCFVAGINGNAVPNTLMVTIDSTNGQLGTQIIPGGGGVSTVNGGNNITTTNPTGPVVTINLTGTTNHAVQVGNSTGSLTSLGIGTNGQVLLGSTAANPSFITPTAGTGLTITTNATTLQYALSVPVSIANGGTNATSMTVVDGTVIYDGTRLVTTATGTAGQVLTSNGAGVAPTYQAASSGGLANSFLFFQATNTPDFTGITTYTLGNSVALTSIVNNGGAFFGGSGAGAPATFTAPATGVYYFTVNIAINTHSAFGGTFFTLSIVTTARTYQSTNSEQINTAVGSFASMSLSTVADMSIGDTATFSIANLVNITPLSYYIQGSATIITSVSGYRIA